MTLPAIENISSQASISSFCLSLNFSYHLLSGVQRFKVIGIRIDAAFFEFIYFLYPGLQEIFFSSIILIDF